MNFKVRSKMKRIISMIEFENQRYTLSDFSELKFFDDISIELVEADEL